MSTISSQVSLPLLTVGLYSFGGRSCQEATIVIPVKCWVAENEQLTNKVTASSLSALQEEQLHLQQARQQDKQKDLHLQLGLQAYL